MSELAGFGPTWLPASVLRRQVIEERAEAKAGRDAERDREAAIERSCDAALASYRAAAEERGEFVSAMALATGQGIGRSLSDVLADATAQADMADAREAGRLAREARGDVEHVFIGEPSIGRSASGWPSTEYEFERMVATVDQLHRDLVVYRARHGYGDALDAARSKAAGGEVSRSRAFSGELNTYQMPASGWEAVRAADAAAGEMRRGVEGAIVSVR